MSNGNAEAGTKKVHFLNGSGSVVVPLGLLSVLVVGMANLAISREKGIADRVRRETQQDSAIAACVKAQEKLEKDLRNLKEVDIKIIQRHQANVEIALKTAKLME